MHVDGFRFDLASALARELHAVDRLSAFFDIIQQDPVIRTVKLIAEPWDVGEGGYQVGNFPAHWSEWNGRYRDTVRDFWRGQPDMLHDFGRRFTGSADLYQDDGRRPSASVNLVTAHDGFTLADLVSYDHKHNEANGEDDARRRVAQPLLELRRRGADRRPRHPAPCARGSSATCWPRCFLSQGVPMLLGGDELGRTQRGNNNAYCQDSELSWYDWAAVDEPLLDFTRRLIALRRAHPVFRRRRWFLDGHPGRGGEQVRATSSGSTREGAHARRRLAHGRRGGHRRLSLRSAPRGHGWTAHRGRLVLPVPERARQRTSSSGCPDEPAGPALGDRPRHGGRAALRALGRASAGGRQALLATAHSLVLLRPLE